MTGNVAIKCDSGFCAKVNSVQNNLQTFENTVTIHRLYLLYIFITLKYSIKEQVLSNPVLGKVASHQLSHEAFDLEELIPWRRIFVRALHVREIFPDTGINDVLTTLPTRQTRC